MEIKNWGNCFNDEDDFRIPIFLKLLEKGDINGIKSTIYVDYSQPTQSRQFLYRISIETRWNVLRVKELLSSDGNLSANAATVADGGTGCWKGEPGICGLWCEKKLILGN